MLWSVKRPDGSFIEITHPNKMEAFGKASLCDSELWRLLLKASESNLPTRLKAAAAAGYTLEEVKIVSVG